MTVLTLNITMQSRWHVGSGDGSNETDAPLYRIGGRPAVPASQLKDLVREHAMGIAETIPSLQLAVASVFGGPGGGDSTGEWQWTSAIVSASGDNPEGPDITTAVSVHHRRDPFTGVVPLDGMFDMELADPRLLVATAGPRDGIPAEIDHVMLVGLAAASVRRLGKRRARGLGRCRIEPVWDGLLEGDDKQVNLNLAEMLERCSEGDRAS